MLQRQLASLTAARVAVKLHPLAHLVPLPLPPPPLSPAVWTTRRVRSNTSSGCWRLHQQNQKQALLSVLTRTFYNSGDLQCALTGEMHLTLPLPAPVCRLAC